MLSKEDRLAFSLAIVSADAQIKGLNDAGVEIQKLIDKAQALDTANSHLFNPTNALIDFYQVEFNSIDGQVRTSIVEQNVLDSAFKVLGNYFFPNSVLLSIPSLSGLNNVWSQIKPFALAFGVGKQYNQTYGVGPSEQAFLATAQSLISSASGFSDIENTSGQHCVNGGSCSNPIFLTQLTCTGGGGTWTPSETIEAFPAVQTLKSDLVSAINSIKTQAIAEAAAISSIVDSDPTRTAQNAAALAYINSTLLPALNTWLAYSDFNTAHGQTTCAGFNGFDANLLAPTKLHSTELAILSSAISARSSFLTTRVAQVNANLGSISQNISTGDYTGTGFYKSRFDYLNLRVNAINGSLTELVGLQQSLLAQNQIKSGLVDQRNIYMSFLPTTKFAASGNGTPIISLVDASFYSPGDTVFIASDTQDELIRAIKSINVNSVVLNDVVPAKYTKLDNTRFYKDLT